MATHVFIVKDDTFPIHLQYLFAGTGAYNQNKHFWLDWHIGLLSDIKRVRADDLIIFYMEANAKIKGGFYGIFKIADESPVVFHTPTINGFQPNLPNNKLIYRTMLEPYEVYPEGVAEWEALDKLPVYATEIQWSLIYRKLKAKRGCTPLLPWEAQRLISMIRDKNSGKPIADTQFTGGFDWDNKGRKIIPTSSREAYPYSRRYSFNPVEAIRCVQNYQVSYETYLEEISPDWKVSPQHLRRNKSYESYLQLYFTENIGVDTNFNPIVGGDVVWFGNEVACGVGMQKMDILTICQNDDRKEYRIVELKDEPVESSVVEQVGYYVNWASQSCGRHLDSAFNWNIQPVIVAPPHKLNKWHEVTGAFRDYNQKHISLPILYFEFVVQNEQSISFQRVAY